MGVKDQAMRRFVQRLTACQPRLYAYIMTLLLDPHQADDVLQQTNLVLWEKLDEFLVCDDFDALACKVAYYQVLAHRRDASRRRRRLLFDDRLLEQVAATAGATTGAFQEGYLAALRNCMAKLPEPLRELVRKRYEPDGSVNAIAADSGNSANAVSASLYRIRKNLLACIHDELARGGDR
jgi:RNA polymerase sigma-70 factor, ECF subfamily